MSSFFSPLSLRNTVFYFVEIKHTTTTTTTARAHSLDDGEITRKIMTGKKTGGNVIISNRVACLLSKQEYLVVIETRSQEIMQSKLPSVFYRAFLVPYLEVETN